MPNSSAVVDQQVASSLWQHAHCLVASCFPAAGTPVFAEGLAPPESVLVLAYGGVEEEHLQHGCH